MRAIQAVLVRNLLKFFRDRMRFIFTLLMSGFFLFIFSFVMKATVMGLDHPMNYLISGIIIMTVFQTALNNSMSILDDISSGFMKEILVAPIGRWEIAVGHVLSSSVISVLQGIIILCIGFVMGLRINAIHFAILTIIMFFVGITFSSMGLFLAAISKESTTFQILITIVSMPLTFLSGAYIPTMVLPKVVLPVVFLNPLTYTTAIFRFVCLNMEHMSTAELVKTGVAFNLGSFTISPYIGALMVMAIGVVFFVLCVNEFGKADFSRVKVFRRKHP
jgi:ABC-2 type transport system permease protein